MAALVQSFPPPASTVTMLQTRPVSASGALQVSSQGQAHHGPRTSQMPRTVPYASNNSMPMGTYRNQSPLQAVQPYAFTSTPSTNPAGNMPRQTQLSSQLRLENRANSAVTGSAARPASSEDRQRYPAASSVSTTSSSSSDPSVSGPSSQPKDDIGIPSQRPALRTAIRPASSINLTTSTFGLTTLAASQVPKPSPDRYRRSSRRIDGTNLPLIAHAGNAASSGIASSGKLYNHPHQSNSSPSLQSFQPFGSFGNSQQYPSLNFPPGQVQTCSNDDSNIYWLPANDPAKRYRRRSISSLDAAEYARMGDGVAAQGTTPQRPWTRPSNASSQYDRRASIGPAEFTITESRNSIAESDVSARSSHSRPSSSSKREPSSTFSTPMIASPALPKSDAKVVNIPPRGSSEPSKRMVASSPLSKPMIIDAESNTSKDTTLSPRPSNLETDASVMENTTTKALASPAAQQLATINEKDAKKGVKSRLRRAFSFGSAAELRRASAENNMINAAERSKLRKDRYQDEREAEQAAIVLKQEEGGIGEGIYSGQGAVFTGSTDNLSISSTASSASIMIRKMGKGMKKSTRSLVGLFRPKSGVGVPAADASAPEASMAQVSMVTVEAERERVNVNAHVHDQPRGGTGFPKLERNSIDSPFNDADFQDSLDEKRRKNEINSRRSIIGGERERAEVLAAVKKGILKRSGTDSGSSSPLSRSIDTRPVDFNLPSIPISDGTPSSSAPSTPNEDRPAHIGHRRTDSVNIEGEDYFMTEPRFTNLQANTRSAPNTPQGVDKHNVIFSPRIQFHDTWTSGEYDRRGEIATCNRLTPMLAQQIKEELNSFKMEMEVHEQSKVYTHFF
ncbi:MAG: bud neck involved protein [Trizodia sp. TS-e1964]|nr:MAG: bud neck involved protein [Trizodia sp. TS-e1964]